jgi:hypothetical protein
VAAITDTQPNTFTSQQTDAVSPSKLVSKVQPIKSTDSPAPAAVRKRTRRAAEMSSELVYDSDENEDAAEDDHAMAIRLHQDLNNSRQSSVGSRRVTRAPAGDKRLKSKTVSTDAAPKKRGNNAFNQPLLLSAAMSALFGGVHEKVL